MLITVVDKLENDSDDPIVSAFLSFLENNMSKNLAAGTALDADTITSAKTLKAGVSIKDDDLE